MKKLFIIVVAIFCSVGLNAQYLQNLNVQNTDYSKLSESQLNLAYNKAEKNVSTGKTLVGVGAGATIIGIVIYVSSLNSIVESTDYDYSGEMAGSTAGTLLALGGGTMAGIGISLWIGGSNKMESIEIHLVKFKSPQNKPVPGIGLAFNF